MGTPVPLTPQEVAKGAVAEWIKDKTNSKCIGFICRECAIELGGEWPEHHVATMHNGMCGVCGLQKGVCSPSDWQLGRDGRRKKISPYEWD